VNVRRRAALSCFVSIKFLAPLTLSPPDEIYELKLPVRFKTGELENIMNFVTTVPSAIRSAFLPQLPRAHTHAHKPS
jgi:hypothetical protein